MAYCYVISHFFTKKKFPHTLFLPVWNAIFLVFKDRYACFLIKNVLTLRPCNTIWVVFSAANFLSYLTFITLS